jgi:putative cell wall-binding protein
MPVSRNHKIPFLLLLILASLLLLPAVATADTVYSLDPVSDSDYNFIVGDTGSINMRIVDDDGEPFSGNIIRVTLTDPDGNETSYSPAGSSNLTISGVLFDIPGTYYLRVKIRYEFEYETDTDPVTIVTDTAAETLKQAIYVEDMDISPSGTMVVNDSSPTHFITAAVTDSEGNVLPRKEITVDGTEVGVMNTLKLTTNTDGEIKFSMAQLTPLLTGTIYYLHGGCVIGSQSVQAAYTAGERLGGSVSGNTDLSVKVSRQGWENADNVILTRNDVLADALTAVPLSKKLDAPILMTAPAGLDNAVLQEIVRLGAHNIYLTGGTAAISAELEQSLQDKGYVVSRLAGKDRYETAAAIAVFVGSKGTVYLAAGYGEPDALAAAAFAAEEGNPILLTERTDLPAAALASLQTLAPDNIIILGGTGVIAPEIESLLKTQYAVERWGGGDRYGTEKVIFQNLFKGQAPLYFASALVKPEDLSSGIPFGDALVSAALAAKTGGFVIIVPPDNLPASISTFLLFNKGYISTAIVIGNKTAISANLEKDLQDLLAH